MTVQASDGAERGEYAVTVTVTPVDEPPVIEGPTSVTDFPENSPTMTVVGEYEATDPERSAGLTWSTLSGNDSSKFELDSEGRLRFKTPPDFEQQSEYEVTVNASDGGTDLGSLDVTVTLEDVNEAPTIDGPVTVNYTENGTEAVATYSAEDQDAGATHTWSVAGTDGGTFEISDTGDLRFKSPPDYDVPHHAGHDNEYEVTVQVYDGANRVTRPVVVRVQDVNEAPTVDGNLTPSFAENSTAVVATYTAGDPERGAITWSLDGAGASDSTISDAGVLSFASAPNYETRTEHTVTVRASDGTNNVDTAVTVTVTNVNEDEEIMLAAPGNTRWEITVRPTSDGDIVIVVPATQDCGAQGAICTADGRMLSGAVRATVSGQSPPSPWCDDSPASGACIAAPMIPSYRRSPPL